MSRILDSFPEAPRRKSVSPKYDWEKWFDGRVHALTRDEFGDPYVFRNAAHSVANRKGVRLKTVMLGDELVLQVTLPVIRLANSR
jgi:hypothetical protein